MSDPKDLYPDHPGKSFLDSLSNDLFGLTLDDAHKARKCISCKRTLDMHSLEPVDVDEWLISGLCPTCFEKLTKEPNNEPDRDNTRKLHIER